MKKFLSMLLVVVLCLTGLIACGGNNNAEDAAALEDAASYLNAMYKDKATNTPNDYDVVAKVVVNGKSYSVTWTTSDERVTVKEGKTANFWTIDVPDVATEEIAYTLTATITDANGNSAQKSFERVVPVVDKGGITNYTKFLAGHYGQYGIRVNCAELGGLFNYQNEIFVERYNKKTMLGRMANNTDLKGLIVYLASDASLYMTGAIIPLDGGYSAK